MKTKIRKAVAIGLLGLMLPLTACSALVAESSTETATTSTESSESTTDTSTEDSTTESDDSGIPAAPEGAAPEGGAGPGGEAGADTVATSTDDLDALIETALGDANLGIHRGHQPIETVLDEVLAISHDELHVRMDSGQNLATVAEDLGIDPQTLIDALVDYFQPVIDQALEDGVIDEAQAEDYHQQLVDAFTERVNYEG
ncbi:hypothetical protein [Promicromonospora sp. NFX87]|uniref:hypothetical protein n=1 Tax=Promicromonospora sp. NFX87 TaxID=3402691 RepID=UPI003AFA17B0